MMGENVKAPACGGVMYLGVPHYCDHPYLPKSMRKESCACRPSPATALPDGMERYDFVGEVECGLEPSLHGDWVLYSQAQSALAAMRVERDEALEAENEAKDCFWTIYPRYLELGGEPVSTEAARTDLAAQVQRLTEDNEALRAERDEWQGKWAEADEGEKLANEFLAIDKARIKALEKALGPFADKPDDWTVDQVNAARLLIEEDGK